MPADESGNLATTTQKLFSHNDDDSSFSAGVDSVTLTFPKAMQPKVTAQLSRFPSRLPFVQGSSFTDPKVNRFMLKVGKGPDPSWFSNDLLISRCQIRAYSFA